MTEPTESDTAYSIKCPVCGGEITDLWEHGSTDTLESKGCEIECGVCGAELLLTCRVRVTYRLTEAHAS